MVNLRIFSPKNFVLIWTHIGCLNKFSLVAQTAIFGKSGNLHKSKMTTGHIIKNYFVTTCLGITIIAFLRVLGCEGSVSGVNFKVRVMELNVDLSVDHRWKCLLNLNFSLFVNLNG